MSKRKHRWMLYERGWRVQCRDCREYGTMEDVNSILDKFYANNERRCETCRHFHSGTYTCDGEWAPLKCVLNDFDGWEARNE